MSNGKTKSPTVQEILLEIDRRTAAARRLGFGASYVAALNDLAGWIESESEGDEERCPHMTEKEPRKIVRRLDTPENRAFWASADKIAKEVASWPDWKKAKGPKGNVPMYGSES